MGKRLHICQTQLAEIGKVKRTVTGNVAKRVASLVAVRSSVGHGADADTVQNNPDDSTEHGGGCYWLFPSAATAVCGTVPVNWSFNLAARSRTRCMKVSWVAIRLSRGTNCAGDANCL